MYQQEVDELRRAGNLKCADDAYAEAKQLFSEALKLKPDAAQLLINRAFCLIMTGDPARAVRALASLYLAVAGSSLPFLLQLLMAEHLAVAGASHHQRLFDACMCHTFWPFTC